MAKKLSLIRRDSFYSNSMFQSEMINSYLDNTLKDFSYFTNSDNVTNKNNNIEILQYNNKLNSKMFEKENYSNNIQFQSKLLKYPKNIQSKTNSKKNLKIEKIENIEFLQISKKEFDEDLNNLVDNIIEYKTNSKSIDLSIPLNESVMTKHYISNKECYQIIEKDNIENNKSLSTDFNYITNCTTPSLSVKKVTFVDQPSIHCFNSLRDRVYELKFKNLNKKQKPPISKKIKNKELKPVLIKNEKELALEALNKLINECQIDEKKALKK